MNQLSSKKLFFYISLSFVLCYFCFVIIAYSSKWAPVLYDIKTCSSYYMFTYLLLAMISYAIDTQTRKEPAFLTLFCLPAFTTIYLMVCVLFSGVGIPNIMLLLVVMAAIFILGYIVYKKWIIKVLEIKNGYPNILFIYTVFHLMIALYISFEIFGYM